MNDLICARCYKNIQTGDATWAILTGGTMLVPTCRDDRYCIDRRGMFQYRKSANQTKNKITELANRFAQ